MEADDTSDRGLLIGEVTPEVRAFLESMGRKVSDDPVHQATRVVSKRSRVSRHVSHFPPAWGPVTISRWPHVHQASVMGLIREDPVIELELGPRAANALRMNTDNQEKETA